MILDVGCGTTPEGNVNGDLYINDIFNHRNQKKDTLQAKKMRNFVKLDCYHLPFKNATFEKVLCKQVIEHCREPLLLLKELSRVSNDLIIVETVHWFARAIILNPKKRAWEKKHHISKFNFKKLGSYAKYINCYTIKQEVINYSGFPLNQISFLSFCNEIRITYRKIL